MENMLSKRSTLSGRNAKVLKFLEQIHSHQFDEDGKSETWPIENATLVDKSLMFMMRRNESEEKF
jgi:hypothetical protein